jgi:peptidoglycan/LPS O-acetylase OafA/YrhL
MDSGARPLAADVNRARYQERMSGRTLLLTIAATGAIACSVALVVLGVIWDRPSGILYGVGWGGWTFLMGLAQYNMRWSTRTRRSLLATSVLFAAIPFVTAIVLSMNGRDVDRIVSPAVMLLTAVWMAFSPLAQDDNDATTL